jgi:hypothetical protein
MCQRGEVIAVIGGRPWLHPHRHPSWERSRRRAGAARRGTGGAELSIGPDGKVDVHVDRRLIGHLTPRMSERHAPLRRRVRDAGLPCSCPARQRRDDKGIVQVTLTVQA